MIQKIHRRWYHSSCCGLTQPQVRALQKAIDAGSDDDGPSWFCDSCDAAGKKNAALSKYYAAVPAAKPAKSAKQDSSAGSAWKWGTDEESEMVWLSWGIVFVWMHQCKTRTKRRRQQAYFPQNWNHSSSLGLVIRFDTFLSNCHFPPPPPQSDTAFLYLQ